ncbi:MAG TPA: DUF2339 domain-containing protein [Pyrinomonadaceae bacterium]|nr:DUF2339 domain-containing protein [Pyrinomonadaceae bacterium]
MAEDLPAEELLKQISERLDLFERVLATNTARLHEIEKHLGPEHLTGERQQQRTAEIFAAEKNELSSPAGETSPVSPPIHEVPQPARPQTESPEKRPQAQSPEQTSLRSEAEVPPSGPEARTRQDGARKEVGVDLPPTSEPQTSEPPYPTPPPGSSSTKDASAQASTRDASIPHSGDSRTYATRPADAPFPLRANVEEPAADQYASAASDASHIDDTREEKHRDLESTIGGSWFNWIGIMAVTFGVAFFLKYAFDKQWIGPAGRISISALVGIGLLALGERLRRRLSSYAYVLSGGGILILYLSVFAAYNFYQLISQPTAFVLMAAVTTTAVLLSVRLDALPVALLGLVGGFLTPLLLSTGVDNQIGLFTYIALLDAGVLAVAYFKRWRSLDFASFAGTAVMTLGWAFKFYEPGKVWISIFFLSVFFVLYSLLAIFHNVLPRRPTRWFDVSLAMANASFYFCISYAMLDDAGFDHTTPATQALLVSIYFTALFFTTWRLSPRDLLLRYSYVCAAATFLTLAVAIQLELHWVTIAWAVEALMLTWVGLRSGEKAARHAGLAVFCIALAHWVLRDMLAINYSVDLSFLPLLNRRALSGVVLVGAIAAASRLYSRANWEGKLELERSTVQTFFALTGNTLALTLLTLDVNDYFVSRAGDRNSYVNSELYQRIQDSRQFAISVLWTIYAAMLVGVGLLRRSTLLRWGGLGLLLAAVSKVLVIDSAFYAASWHLPLLNQTFISYALLVAVCVFTAWLYRRVSQVDDGVEEEQRALLAILLGTANLLALTALSLEVVGYYEREIAALALTTFGFDEIVRQFEERKLSTLTVVWTLYALYAFMVGLGRKNRAMRLGGLLLLGITTLLVIANLSYYNASWHTFVFNRTMGVFAVFIAALWLVVRSYRRSSEVFEEAKAAHHTAIVVANVLAIIALSAQAAGYYEARIAEEFGRARAAELLIDGSTTLRNLELAKQLSLSVIWAVYASGLLVAGHLRRLRLLRVMGLALLSLTVLKVFLWDLSSLDRVYRIISFIMLGAILLVVSYFYQRSQQPVDET